MDNQWLTDTPDEPTPDPHATLKSWMAYLAAAPELLFAGFGSVSLKITLPDPFGDPQDVLVYHHPAGESTLSLGTLQRIPTLKEQSQLQAALQAAKGKPGSGAPDDLAVLHACLPAPVVLFTLPTHLLAWDLTNNPADSFQAAFGQKVQWLAETDLLAQTKTLSNQVFAPEIEAIFIHQLGLFVFGPTLKAASERLAALVNQAKTARPATLPELCAPTDPLPSKSHRTAIATLRRTLSEAAGTLLLMRVVSNPSLKLLIEEPSFRQQLVGAPLAKPLADVFGNGFLAADNLPGSLPANNLLLDPELGLVVTSQTAAGLSNNVDLACKALQAAWAAWQTGAMAPRKVKAQGGVTPSSTQEHDKSTMFVGEIALVTGAASGIGRGCALSLLARGAAVIGLDINPAITEVSDSPAYSGLVCDLTDESAVTAAFENFTTVFGGLDMVVLNAGIFPKSVLINEMDLAAWQKVMHINLDVNVTLLRESYPLLKEAPAKGRVLVNASRNVPAPGPGAAAYSTSKAGLTQLARVAALEWGKDGIRVNMIHPHAVFDTGIWTDDVLKSRAEKYGVTVQEYKTRNVLKVELTSHDIGELVCEMLGPVFSKTTGAQVPVDGGSDRVI